MSRHCDFCDEFSSGTNNAFSRLWRSELTSRVLFASDDFAVLPTLGQIVDGHLLIVPIKHYTAMADVATEMQPSLSVLINHIKDLVARLHGPTILFEHGIRGTSAGGCGVDHAHIHVVPFVEKNAPISELTSRHCFSPVKRFADIGQLLPRNSPYLYYQQTNGDAWASVVSQLPSQYMRRLVAAWLGTRHWDWTKAGKEESLVRCISNFAPLINEARLELSVLSRYDNQMSSSATV